MPLPGPISSPRRADCARDKDERYRCLGDSREAWVLTPPLGKSKPWATWRVMVGPRGKTSSSGVGRLSLGPATKPKTPLPESSRGPEGGKMVSERSRSRICAQHSAEVVPPRSSRALTQLTVQSDVVFLMASRRGWIGLLGVLSLQECTGAAGSSDRWERLGPQCPVTAVGPAGPRGFGRESSGLKTPRDPRGLQGERLASGSSCEMRLDENVPLPSPVPGPCLVSSSYC